MKRLLFVTLVIIVFSACSCGGKKTKDNTISMSGAFALYPMAIKWSEEYKKTNSDIYFNISAGGAGKGMADTLSGMVDMGMVSREVSTEEIERGAWFVSVAIDAVIPVMNSANPLHSEIKSKGLRKEEFASIWDKDTPKKWNKISRLYSSDVSLNVFTRSDACGAAQTWGAFFGKKQEQLNGVGVYGDPGIAEAVRKDPLGIGYNNINFAYDKDTKKSIKGLSVIPIDINGNGKIDNAENIYNTRDELTHAIAEGKFPSPPARKLYLVLKGAPQKESIKSFLKWIMTDGQKYVQDTGYIMLLPEEMKLNINKLGDR